MQRVTGPIELSEEHASTCLASIQRQIEKLKTMRGDAPEWDVEPIDESIKHYESIDESLSRQLYPNADRWKNQPSEK